MKRIFPRLAGWLIMAASALCAEAQAPAPPMPGPIPNEATAATREVNRAQLAGLSQTDQQDFEAAQRGLIEATPDLTIPGPSGTPAFTLKGYEFLANKQAPDTVNPALWRHARLNMASGLFKVTERVYQVRGHDMSNITIVEGDTGLIVTDSLTTTETARAAMALYFKHRPQRPVVALIYSHSHIDHFGGARGVISGEDVVAGKVQVIAPAGFMQEALSENVIAGNAMSRRAMYQFGLVLPRGERGMVDAGLGKPGVNGTISLIPPTVAVEKPLETRRIDGVDIVFELTPGAEAPAEMIMYYPQFRVLNMAEITTQGMHNLLPMRGALVRNALAWSKYIGGALQRYGTVSDVLIAQHNWPVWGAERIQDFLKKQRDTYKFVHDQTVRLLNHGYVAGEIAEIIKMPPALAQDMSTRAFYGDLKNNIKAVYQRYLGYYDGNPINLEALPPVRAALKTVEYMGGADAVLKRAREDYAKGDYRWVAQVTSQLVFADPSNRAARELAADAYEQIGYQQESATARNAFLEGALELRNGLPKLPSYSAAAPDVIRAMPLDMYFDYLGVRLDGDKALGKTLVLNWQLTDTHQNYVLNLENSALTYTADSQAPDADVTLIMTRATLDEISLRKTTFPAALQAGQIVVTGRREKLAELLGMFDTFTLGFPMIEPRPARHAGD